MNSTVKTLFLWAAIFVLVVVLWNTFQSGRIAQTELDYSELIQKVAEGKVAEVTIRGQQQLTGKFKAGGEYTAGQEFKTTLVDRRQGPLPRLRRMGVRIRARGQAASDRHPHLGAKLLLISAVDSCARCSPGSAGPLSFGKRAKLPPHRQEGHLQGRGRGRGGRGGAFWGVEFRGAAKFRSSAAASPRGSCGPPAPARPSRPRHRRRGQRASPSPPDFVEMFVGVSACASRLVRAGEEERPASSSSTRSTPSAAPGPGSAASGERTDPDQLLVEMDG